MTVRKLIAAVTLSSLTTACASSGAVPRPFPVPGGGPPAARHAESAQTIVAMALSLRGVPYRNGGSDPDGFDCSGFVQYVFGRNGLTMPREVREQWRAGRPVDTEGVSPGDLLFFATDGSGASHVGIAVGSDEFVHAPSSKGVVRVERVSTPYWSQRYVGARRITN